MQSTCGRKLHATASIQLMALMHARSLAVPSALAKHCTVDNGTGLRCPLCVQILLAKPTCSSLIQCLLRCRSSMRLCTHILVLQHWQLAVTTVDIMLYTSGNVPSDGICKAKAEGWHREKKNKGHR
jgi:hypothetical protein